MSSRNTFLNNFIVAAALVTTASVLSIHRADAAEPAAHWTGAIKAPGKSVAIAVDLKPDQDNRWVGNIDIPSQRMVDFPLDDIVVDGRKVKFSMPGVPGNPRFHGKLSDDDSRLTGRFSQGGTTLTFQLERNGEPDLASAPASPVIPTAIAAELAGRWEGRLAVSGQQPRLALVLSVDDERGLIATLDSPDEGQTGMPISQLRIDGDTLRAELSMANAAFEGQIDAARTTITGEWQQGGKHLPLVLHRVAESAASAFPPAEPESVGIPAKALALLDQRVQALIDSQQIVGGELLVIKNRRNVFRKAYGWKDRDAATSLDIDAIYCVRSMTKPLVGTAIQMLIDEGRLQLDTPVRDILPAFDRPQDATITIEQLLTHTAGFPFTTMSRPMSGYRDLADVANEAATAERLFEPGSDFQYSDASADVLGAIVAAVTDMPLEQYIQQRILDPLAMDDTLTLLGDNAAMKQRIPVAYSGGTGAWSKHWEPSDPPLFPIFLGSQSLYSTTVDYAKFLALWMDAGVVDGKRLFSASAAARALLPQNAVGHHDANPADTIKTFYGQQWIVRAETDANDNRRRVMFGHDGSDGTHAWAWPEQDLMVLFFTQSRGTLAGADIERSVESLLIDQQLDDVGGNQASRTAAELQEFGGLYWDEDVEHGYYVITPRGDGLVLDRPGAMHLVFKPGGVDGRFVAEANPKVWIAFDRADDGSVESMRRFFGKRVEHNTRQVDIAGLPSAEKLNARVREAHHIDRLDRLGAARLTGSIEFVTRKMMGSVSATFDTHSNRTEIRIGESRQITMTDGKRAWTSTTETGTDELAGRMRQEVMLDRLPVLLGNWSEHFQQVDVLKRIEIGGRSMILVRVVPEIGSGTTLFIDEDSGQLIRTDVLAQVPGVGIIGVQTMFDDYRDVDGMQVPFHIRSKFQHPLIGLVETRYENSETGVKVTPTTFAPPPAE